MKIYPLWTDFAIEQIMYGVCAPYVGCGTYTLDKKFMWPDRECTTKHEYELWVNHLKNQGYSIPEEYLNAYVKECLE